MEMLVSSNPFWKKVLVIVVKVCPEADFLVLSSFAWFFYLFINILSKTVDVY